MRHLIVTLGLAALVAAPTAADASCKGRKNTGTALGAIAGGLFGNAVAGHGAKTEGALLGAGVGAVVGHQVAKSGCTTTRTAYRRTYTRSARASTPARYRYADNTASCRYESRPYYDERGQLVYAQTRVCGR